MSLACVPLPLLRLILLLLAHLPPPSPRSPHAPRRLEARADGEPAPASGGGKRGGRGRDGRLALGEREKAKAVGGEGEKPAEMPREEEVSEALVMASVALSELRTGWNNQPICVRLSRLWHYRGGLEYGPVKLIHMVLIDAQGICCYAVVATDFITTYINMLHEGVVYELSRFVVLPRPVILNPIEAPLMIKFTQFTIIKNRFHLNDVFPEWTFNLTPINELPPLHDTPQTYIDVIGVITAISPVSAIRVPNTSTKVFKRRVMLSNYSGHELGITLWGERAIRFNGESVHFMSQTDPAVVIFVGTTVCMNEGSKELSGGCACKWYINHDIPDINIFRSRLPPSFPAIQRLPAPSKIILQQQHADVPPIALLTHLININLYHKEAGTFRCNVTITRVPHLKKWWNTFCTDCHYMSMPSTTSLTQPNVYTCARGGCSCTHATIRYTLTVLAKDQSGEAEFELFESIAEQIIGQSARQVLHNSMRHDPIVRNVHVAASILKKTPPELTALLSMRCRFIVRASHDCFFARWPSFHVCAVESFEPMKTNLSVMDLITPS